MASHTRRRPSSARPPSRMRRWRRHFDSVGGPCVVLTGVALLAVVGLVVVRSLPQSASTAPLMGTAVTLGPATHVTSADALAFPTDRPPAGGPHLGQPLPAGFYGEPVSEGMAIHSLEHGMIYIAYAPERLDAAALEQLRRLQSDFGADVIVGPRPGDRAPVAATSWGRLLELEAVDMAQLRSFITTNRNRSPEPGVR